MTSSMLYASHHTYLGKAKGWITLRALRAIFRSHLGSKIMIMSVGEIPVHPCTRGQDKKGNIIEGNFVYSQGAGHMRAR